MRVTLGKKASEKVSKARKCLEIGRSLAHVEARLNHIWSSAVKKNAVEMKERARVALEEIGRLNEKFPLTKPDTKSVVKVLDRMAAGKGQMTPEAVESIRSVVYKLHTEANRACS